MFSISSRANIVIISLAWHETIRRLGFWISLCLDVSFPAVMSFIWTIGNIHMADISPLTPRSGREARIEGGRPSHGALFRNWKCVWWWMARDRSSFRSGLNCDVKFKRYDFNLRKAVWLVTSSRWAVTKTRNEPLLCVSSSQNWQTILVHECSRRYDQIYCDFNRF